MPRRLGKTIGMFIAGACVFLLFAHALFGKRLHWPADSLPVMKVESASAERLLSLGTAVLAADGTVVGKVSGLSRDSRGHVERIRVDGPMPMGFGQRHYAVANKPIAMQAPRDLCGTRNRHDRVG